MFTKNVEARYEVVARYGDGEEVVLDGSYPLAVAEKWRGLYARRCAVEVLTKEPITFRIQEAAC